MSQIIKNLLSGPIPPQVLLTLTPNSGGAVSAVNSNINVDGLAANSGGNAYPIFSYNGGAGQFNIENRTYWTPYVVDQSGTNGSKGTFSTIQAAVTQAVADGYTGSNQQNIYIRTGYYTENVSVPNNAALSFVGLGDINVVLGGGWTFGTGCNIQFQGITFLAGSGLTIPTMDSCVFISCNLRGISGASEVITTTGITDGIEFFNCFLDSGSISIAGSTNLFPVTFTNCTLFNGISGTTITTGGSAQAMFLSCYFNSIDIIVASSGLNIMSGCYFYQSEITGSSIATQELYHNIFSHCSTPVNATATFWTASNTADDGSAIFGSNPTILSQPTQMGNIAAITLPGGTSYNVLLTDQFVGCPTTSAFTATLPASPLTGETHTIADISANAGTHNLTISGNGNNIIGTTSASTYVISSNGGTATLVFTGTVWKVI